MIRAKNGTRTRDPNLGKVVLYQLSYFRDCDAKVGIFLIPAKFIGCFLAQFLSYEGMFLNDRGYGRLSAACSPLMMRVRHREDRDPCALF